MSSLLIFFFKMVHFTNVFTLDI
jgi:hypothetical protein